MAQLLKEMSMALLMSQESVLRVIQSAPYRYKVYEIPKKGSHKKRTIAQPSREVKKLQAWMNRNILPQLKIHDAAFAYVKGKSIVTNAAVHRGNSFLLKLDFQDFFPSIRSRDLQLYFQKNLSEYSFEELQLLARLVCRKDKRSGALELSVGAPTSPALSNALLYDYDVLVTAYCARVGVDYSRYADDMVFSTNRKGVLCLVHQHVKEVCLELESPRLTLNEQKTVYSSKRHRRRITGLIISNEGNVSLGRQKKRELRAGVHQYVNGLLGKEEKEKLRGWMAFANSAEPEFVKKLLERYRITNISLNGVSAL